MQEQNIVIFHPMVKLYFWQTNGSPVCIARSKVFSFLGLVFVTHDPIGRLYFLTA